MRSGTDTLETSLVIPQKVKPYDPAIPCLATYPKEMEKYVHPKTVPSGHSKGILIAKNLRPKVYQFDEWINKTSYLHIWRYWNIDMEYCLLMRRSIDTYYISWMNFHGDRR